jgi:hypothetical protein
MSPTRTLMICGSRDATDPMLTAAGRCALRAWNLVCTGWQVIVGDGHGIDAEVIRICENYAIPYICVGISQRPTNGAPAKHYQRAIVMGSTRAERQRQRDRYMVRLADMVICISHGELQTISVNDYAKRLRKQTLLRLYTPDGITTILAAHPVPARSPMPVS